MDTQESWLNGWPRMGTEVLVGVTVHCAGCGCMMGVTTVSFDESFVTPQKDPDWPFAEEDCPVCELRDRVRGNDQDRLTARMLALRSSATQPTGRKD